MKKVKILYLASNPERVAPLKLDEEIRSITQRIRAADHRDRLDIESLWAVRPEDLLQGLLEHKPQIVHFSGHGSQTGEIILMDKNRQVKPVSAKALESLFTALAGNVRVVVLNACYTEIQAAAISEVVDCVVGMSNAVGDDAAVAFAAAFYQGIGFGHSIGRAFDLGKAAIELEGIPEADIPRLLSRRGVDPYEVLVLNGSSAVSPKMELVDALLGCASFRDRGTRDRIVDELPQQISNTITRSDVNRVDAISIVSRCMDFPDGVRILVDRVRAFEGDTIPMSEVEAVLRSW